jgi:hypothetical protein
MHWAPDARQFAPAAIHFEAVSSGFGLTRPATAPAWWDPAMHEIEYVWDFGDAGATFTATENIVPAWKDANRAFGQHVAHVYARPGTYTVTCIARRVVGVDPVEVIEARAATTVTIADPEEVFGRVLHRNGTTQEYRTIVVAKDGDFTGADPDWFRVTTEEPGNGDSYQVKMRQIMEAQHRNAADPAEAGYMRVLFKRGETYDNALATSHSDTNGIMRCIMFSHWGDTQRPPPKFVRAALGGGKPNRFGFKFPSVILDGLDFEGDYDPIAQQAGPATSTGITSDDGAYKLITNCRIRRHSAGVFYNPPRDESDLTTAPALFIHNTEMTELASYGLYAADRNDGVTNWTTIALLGVKDIDVGNAPVGGSGGIDGNSNSQGPVRCFGRGIVIVDGCDFFSRYSWIGAGFWDPPTNTETRVSAQPLRLRAVGTWDGSRARTFLTRTCYEGSGAVVAFASSGGSQSPHGNALVDQVLHVGAAPTTDSFATQMGGVTVRNVLAIKPETADRTLFSPPYKRFFAAVPPDPVNVIPGTLDAPIRLYNNTIVVLQAFAPDTFPVLDRLGAYTNVSVANNLVHAPDYPAQRDHLDFAPFDTTALFEPRWRGRLAAEDAGRLDPDYAAAPGSVSLYQPEEGSPALGAVRSGPVALFDLLGRLRGPRPAIGALEAP